MAGEVDEILAIYEGIRTESLGWGVDATACGGDAEKSPSPVLARFRIGTDDWSSACLELTRRYTLWLANIYLVW